jgi:hypothetical protein
MIAMAIKRRWPIPDEVRQAIVDRMAGFVRDCPDPDKATSAARALIAAEAQNQSDDHLADKNERLDSGSPTEAQKIEVVYVNRMPETQ